jgi:hypothetical protein
MSPIKRFIDKIAMMEGRQAREVVLPMNEAKELRDEITKLLLDQRDTPKSEEVVSVVMKGGKW